MASGRCRSSVAVETWNSAAQGITGAWSTANTREALTAAFKRKEVYATSGPRMQLRMFGGFEFEAEDANARDIAAVGMEAAYRWEGTWPRRRTTRPCPC